MYIQRGQNPSRSRSSRRGKGAAIIAGLTTAGLIFGSTTTALWTDSVNVDGGTITSGNLDVEPIGDMLWSEASVGVEARSIPVLEDYRIIPGNTIIGEQDLDVALKGSNILATLQIQSGAEVTGSLFKADGIEGVALESWIEDKNGNPMTPRRAIGVESPLINIDKAYVSESLDNSTDYKVKIQANFDKSTPEQVRTQAQAFLTKSSVKLEQVRTAASISPVLNTDSAMEFLVDNYTQGVIDVGDQVIYSVDVLNDGVVPMNNVSVTDTWLNTNGTEFTSSGSSFGPFGLKLETSSFNLAPGEKRTYKANHTFTAEQLDSGTITVNPIINYEAGGEVIADSSTATLNSAATQYNAALSSTAGAELNGDGTYLETLNKVDFGETAAISFSVKNESTVNSPIPTMVSVTGGMSVDDFTANKAGELAPGETVVFSASKTFTIEELSTGSFNVSADFKSTVLDEELLTSRSITLETVPVTNTAVMNFTRTLVDSNGNGTADAGERINVAGTWQNTSNVPVLYLQITPNSDHDFIWTKEPTVPSYTPAGMTHNFTGYYIVKPADVTGNPLSLNFDVRWNASMATAHGGAISRSSTQSLSTNTTVQSKTLSFTAASTSGTYLDYISTPWVNTWYPWRETTTYNYPRFYSNGSLIYNMDAGSSTYSGQLWNISKNSVDITIGGISGFSPGIAFNFERSGDSPKGLIAAVNGSYWYVYGSTGAVNAGVSSAYNIGGRAGVTITTLRVVSNGTTAQVYANGNLVWNQNITNLNGYNYSTGNYHGIGGYWYSSAPRFTSFSMTS